MAADFWAGYVSGAVGIIVGNPLDLIKVRLQAGSVPNAATLRTASTVVTGTAAPILGYGALNALLFMSYNRSEAALNKALSLQSSLWTTWAAGALGGLATWVVSTPTELIKCRAQMAVPAVSSLHITRSIIASDGFRGLYFGGVVTALRDSIGYGFYFWSYELANSLWASASNTQEPSWRDEAPKILLCGGIAGVVTWASVFPLDVIKTRVQTQAMNSSTETSPLLNSRIPSAEPHRRAGALEIAKATYAEGGVRPFFRGLTVCSLRAFMVNAVQWAVYEAIMDGLGQGRRERMRSENTTP
jgi:solute carrier family 25 carnitine/acylcarnitine transporter 20/29